MFVDERMARNRWDHEPQDEIQYMPPAFMQLLDSIADYCPVGAICSPTPQHRLKFVLH